MKVVHKGVDNVVIAKPTANLAENEWVRKDGLVREADKKVILDWAVIDGVLWVEVSSGRR